MSKTTDFIINNPVKNFDGSDYIEPQCEPFIDLATSAYKGLSKKGIAEKAIEAVEYTLEYGRPHEVAESLAVMETFGKAVREDARFKEYVREVVQKNGAPIITLSGAKIECAETGVTYDYSQNPQWVEMDEQVKAWTEKRKALEDRLKTIPAGKMLVDDESGETLIGPAKTSKSSYKVTLAK